MKKFEPYFTELFAEGKLRGYTEKQLFAALKAVPLIPQTLENLAYSIRNGAAPSLTAADKPDFMSAESMNSLNTKTHAAGAKNYTNISTGDFMAIFSGDTVKTIGDSFNRLPADSKNVEVDVAQLMGDRKYCISSEEVANREREYQQRIASLNEVMEKSASSRRRHRFIKAELAIIAMFIPSFYAGATGSISPAVSGGCLAVQFLLAVIYMIFG